MSNRPFRHRVLWVEEENDPWGFIEQARRYDLVVYRMGSWEEAKDMLNRHFDGFSAIVLDGKCVLEKGGVTNPDFLYQAVREMETIFAQHEESLPWYVLSSGTAEDFDKTIQRVAMGERTEMTGSWGELYYKKSEPFQELFEAIRKAAAQRKEYKVVRMYKQVFDTLRRYFDPQSGNTMLEILVALHYPEMRRGFDSVLYYTQLRRILEYLFRAANQLGVLPDAVLGEQGKVNLSNSSLYLCGREVTLGRTHSYRYGKPGDSFFSPVMAQLVKSILVVANKNSHSTELDSHDASVIREYNRTIHSDNLLFGYALHLCDVIVYFGQKVEEMNLTPREQVSNTVEPIKPRTANKNSDDPLPEATASTQRRRYRPRYHNNNKKKQ